jgi:glycosyltransferase involved in cell wall biosynthesis
MEVVFVGSVREEDRRVIADLQLQDMVTITGYLPHREAVHRLIDSDVLWLLIGRGRGSDMMSTGKLYEYLGARRTILGTVPEGVARDLLAKSGAAVLVEPDDTAGIAEALLTLYELHKNHMLPVPTYAFVSQFERRHLAGELVKVFGTALHPDPGDTRVHTRSTIHRDTPHLNDPDHPSTQEQ